MPLRPVPSRWAATPVRVDVKPVPDDQRRAANRAVKSVRDAVLRIRETPGGPDPARMAAAFRAMVPGIVASLHEEAQVVFAALSRMGPGMMEANMEPLVTYALASADAEGMVWTPLLDALAQGGGWRHDVQKPRTRLKRLVPWIEKQTDDAALSPLSRFKAGVLAETVVVHMRPELLTTAWIDWAVEHPDLTVARSLWGNPAFGSGERAQIVERALDLLMNPPGPPLHRELESFFMTSVLYGRAHPLGDEQVERLRIAARTPYAAGQRSHGTPGHVIDMVLCMNPTTPEVVIREAMERSPDLGTHWTMAAHPNAPIEQLRIMAQTGGRHHWPVIARNARAMADREVRDAIAGSASAPVMRAFFEASHPEKRAENFRRFLTRHPEAALDYLQATGMPDHVSVSDIPLAALLAHRKQEVRMKAFMLAHTLGVGGATPGEQQGDGPVPADAEGVGRHR